jgi:hypothetical protein
LNTLRSQLEMLSAQPPQLLAMLGFSPSVLQSEIQKHKTMEKLKVRDWLVYNYAIAML